MCSESCDRFPAPVPVFPLRESSFTRGLPLLRELLVLDRPGLIVLCLVAYKVQLVQNLWNSKREAISRKWRDLSGHNAQRQLCRCTFHLLLSADDTDQLEYGEPVNRTIALACLKLR